MAVEPRELAKDAKDAKDPAAMAQRWLQGRMSLAELRGYSEEELAAIAEIGFAYFAQGKYEQAGIVFDGLCALEPKAAYHRKALGAIALAQGRYQPALGHYDDAVRLDGADAEAFLGRAEAYLGLGRPRDAEADFQRAKKIDPDSFHGRRAAALLAALKAVKGRR
jgi:tetratricopeptide (TPR) repeat protein